jgi:hypothetical protein
MLSFANRRHVTVDKLEASRRELIEFPSIFPKRGAREPWWAPMGPSLISTKTTCRPGFFEGAFLNAA